MGPNRPPELPDEMFRFSLLGGEASLLTPRLGRLALSGRKPIETPHYIPISSRGALPHTTHDVMRDHMPVSGLYLALEDCKLFNQDVWWRPMEWISANYFAQLSSSVIEKGSRGQVPPIYNTPVRSSESALRKFLSCRDDIPLILGPRRIPPVGITTPNTPNSISILTSVGVRQLEAGQYTEAIEKLQPDLVVGMADIVVGQPPGVKRRDKMVDRTHAWTRDAFENLYNNNSTTDSQPLTRAQYLAPVLPLDAERQLFYLEDLGDELREHVSGFALYDSSSLAAIPESMAHLVRFSFAQQRTPHEILRDVSLGADVTTIPFIAETTEAGFALDFEFPGPTSESGSARKPLAFDMWPSTHSMSLSPLVPDCQCYTCQKHHRAYIRHLLNAKEMLAWTLLQVHNNHVIHNFFVAIRRSISNGSFSQDMQEFERAYENEFPQQTGKGPR